MFSFLMRTNLILPPVILPQQQPPVCLTSSLNRQPHPLCAGSICELLHLNGNEWSVHLSGGCLVSAPGQTGYKHKNNRYPLHSPTMGLSDCGGSSWMNKTYHNQNLPPQEVSSFQNGLMGKHWVRLTGRAAKSNTKCS